MEDHDLSPAIYTTTTTTTTKWSTVSYHTTDKFRNQ